MSTEIVKKLDAFFQTYSLVDAKKGDILIHAEEPPEGIFYLKSGHVRQYVITPKGEELTVNIYKTPSFFPMMWAVNETPNLFYFEAMGDAQLWRAPKEDVIAFLKREPEVLFDLLSRLMKGMDGVLSRIVYLMAGNARAKIIFTILNMHYRFGETNMDTTHRDLAAISGTSRETFSREIKKLEHENLVIIENGIIKLPDIPKLEEELANINQLSSQLPQ